MNDIFALGDSLGPAKVIHVYHRANAFKLY